jgi:putative transposase
VLRRPPDPGQYTSFRYTQRLADLGIAASVGSVADAFDNAMAESFVGTLKTELIRGPFTTRFDAELAVVEYLGWFNHTRLHSELGDLPPAEFDALHARPDETITISTKIKETN